MKERLAKLFEKTWVKIVAVISIFLAGLFLVGKCSKVEATAFTLANGSTSKITYDEGQLLYFEGPGLAGPIPTYLLFVSNSNMMQGYRLSVGSSTDIFTSCSYNAPILSCGGKSLGIFATTSSSVSQDFTINYDTVTYVKQTFQNGSYVDVTYTFTIIPSYDDGYQAGLEANQDIIYNAGYNNGYSAGESAGLTTGYNNGYSAGESAGLTTGYNNGVADLGDHVVSELGTAPGSQVNISVSCSGVNNSECLANAKGKISSNIDTLVVNSTNSGYETGYIEGENSGYNTGYVEGQNSVDITTDNQTAINNYITDNNYHSNDEYLEYGRSEFVRGNFQGAKISIRDYNNELLIHVEDYYGSDYAAAIRNEFIELESPDNYKENLTLNATTFMFALEDVSGTIAEGRYNDGLNEGYQNGMADKGGLMSLIPATLGAVVGNAMPILTYEVYGISIMNIIGLIAIVGIAIIVVKFVVGG